MQPQAKASGCAGAGSKRRRACSAAQLLTSRTSRRAQELRLESSVIRRQLDRFRAVRAVAAARARRSRAKSCAHPASESRESRGSSSSAARGRMLPASPKQPSRRSVARLPARTRRRPRASSRSHLRPARSRCVREPCEARASAMVRMALSPPTGSSGSQGSESSAWQPPSRSFESLERPLRDASARGRSAVQPYDQRHREKKGHELIP